MASNHLKRSLWMMNELISTSPVGITREELSRKWITSRFNDKKEPELPERTFFRLRKLLQDIFEVEIISRATYWWFTPKDDALHVMSYVSLPDRNAIRGRIETILARLNQLTV